MRNIAVSVLFLLPSFAVAQTPRFDFGTGKSDPIADSYFQFAGFSPAGATWTLTHHSVWKGKVQFVHPTRGTGVEDAVQAYQWTRPLNASNGGGATTITGYNGVGPTVGYLPTVGMVTTRADGATITWLTVESVGPVNNNLNASNGGKSAGIVGAYSK